MLNCSRLEPCYDLGLTGDEVGYARKPVLL
jgi:hypothetical protein